MRHDRRRVVSTPAVDVLRARLSGAPSSRRRSLYCIIEDTAEVDMDDPFRRIVPGEGAQIPKPPTVRQIDRATTRQKRSLTAELPASTFRRATHIVPTSPSPSLPRLPEDVSEVNVGGTFGHGEDVQRPQPLRITPVARPATSQKPSFTLRPPPRNPRRITHAIPPSPSSPTRAPATVRFQTDERPVSRPLRPETSAVSGRRPRSSILSATSTVTSTAASAYPSSYAEDHIWPAVNIVPPTYPPSLHSIYSEDLATPSTSRTRESADTEWTRPLRDPPRRSAWRSSQTAPSPSTATSFLEHPFATNPPVSPRSANTRVKVVLPSPSTSARFPSRPPPFIQDDKPRPASRNEQTDRPPRILSRTFFKAGFRTYICSSLFAGDISARRSHTLILPSHYFLKWLHH